MHPLYSRIGFSHQFQKLSPDEMRFILERRWQELNLVFSHDRFYDVEAINTIIRITAGNFRLMDRLFSQIKRIWKVNRLEAMSKEVVDAARDCLLIGSST